MKWAWRLDIAALMRHDRSMDQHERPGVAIGMTNTHDSGPMGFGTSGVSIPSTSAAINATTVTAPVMRSLALVLRAFRAPRNP